MSRRTHVSLDDKEVDARYSNWISAVIDLIAPKDLWFVGGRATAKTGDIFAKRSQRIAYDMPRCMMAAVSDTYMNAMRNVVPALIEGWERQGWKRGIHYWTDTKPPSHFKDPYKPVETYKHTLSIVTGSVFNLGSLDQPSSLTGGSFQHMFVDEARLMKFEKLKKLFPAVRGEPIRYQHSVYWRGFTATTDMPNVLDGDDDWILQNEKHFDVEQAKVALQVALVLNEIKLEIVAARQMNDAAEIERLKGNLVRWTERWVRARKDICFYYVISTFVNADLLTEGFFETTYKALGIEEFKSAILSFRIEIKKGEKFYTHLGEHHFYTDGIIRGYYDDVPLTEVGDINESSLALKNIDHNLKLEAGMDFGDMMSLVIAQERGNFLYVLKEFYTLPPENSKELALKFLDFFKHHKVKVLDLYYDRSGNQYEKIKRDWAQEFADFIEFRDGISTGWKVNLMNRNQATILHEQEFKAANNILGEYEPKLPKIRIDQFQCKCLKSSLELSKTKVKSDRKGSKTIHKDKSSEKLPMPMRPMFSTNFSDAFKYLICRPRFMKILSKQKTSFDDPTTH